MPSPPMPDASGSTTPSANDTAIAASTMLPPCSSASAPACDASGWPETTTARLEVTSGLISGCSATIASITVSSCRLVARRQRLRAMLRPSSASHRAADGPLA